MLNEETPKTQQEQIDQTTQLMLENTGTIQFLAGTISHNTQRIEHLITDMELIKQRILLLEGRPERQLDIMKTLTPIIAVIMTLVIGSLALEVTTLFFILTHIAGSP